MSGRRRTPKRAADLGVTDAEYFARLEAQGGCCAIEGCNRKPKTRRFHVDHDHKTGRVRGLLCHWHNRIMPKDSAEAYHMFVYLANAKSQAQTEKEWDDLRRRGIV